MDFIADVVASEVRHAVVEVGVGPELVEMFGHGVGVGAGDEEAVLAVGDLKGDAAGVGGDDGFALGRVWVRKGVRGEVGGWLTLWRASETLTSKSSRVESCRTMLALEMTALRS